MRTYNILAGDRKEVKTKLEELTGEKASYSGAPSFAYTLEGITIGNDGTVTAEGEEAETLLQSLVEAGLLEAATEANTAPVLNENEEAEEVPAGEGNAPETAQEAGNGETQMEPSTEGSEDNDSTEESSEPEEVKPEISMPLSQHAADTLCNLIFTIYSKGDLLSKSSGGDFFVSEALKEKLKSGAFTKKEQVLEILNDAQSGDLRGLAFSDDKVTFIGFPATEEAENIQAWTLLAAAINKAALTQKRVLPRRNEETNEKFAFRTWLTRLGMNGPELKSERQFYYKNLSGHTAFRTPADEEKWKKRQAERKAERLAAQTAAVTEENTQETAEA